MIETKIDFIAPIQELTIELGQLLAKVKARSSNSPVLELRKQNKIKTVFSTTKIEGNCLSLDEVTALIDGVKVKGDKKQILEVKNTIALYEMLDSLDPLSEMDFLLAHRVLMKGLIKTNGAYRKVNVGISSKVKIKNVFPTHSKVKSFCADLFDYIENSKDNFLIKSCVAHYQIESIHPFEDGNGRLGRFWHTLILSSNFEIFHHLPIESFIRKRQDDYYEALFIGQKANSPTLFVKFMLEVLCEALRESFTYRFSGEVSKQQKRFNDAKEHFKTNSFSRRDYLALLTNLSPSMATKDLKEFCNQGELFKSGVGNGTRYEF